MKDAQFMSELLLVVLESKQHGFDQDMLNDAYGRYDDLEEADVEVDPDGVKERFASAKQYLVAAQNQNACIKDYATTLGAFYTVWALVALHRADLPDSTVFAERFKSFMEKVKMLDTSSKKTDLLSGENSSDFEDPMAFLDAYRGASTDLAPRLKRFEALRNYMTKN